MTDDKANQTHTSARPDARELNLNDLESVSGGGHKTGKQHNTKPAEFVIFRLSQFSGGGSVD